jgi:hypothetical protein
VQLVFFHDALNPGIIFAGRQINFQPGWLGRPAIFLGGYNR